MGVIVLHDTEGSWQSAVATFAQKPGTQPHRLIDPAQDIYKDYIDWNKPAKALANTPGGVETNNRGGVYQIEIVGFAKLIPTMSDNWYSTLAKQLKEVAAITGTPIKFPCPFLPVGQVKALSDTEWMTVEGIIGHQHVPENVNAHSDPGDISRIIPLMLKREYVVDKTSAQKVVRVLYLIALDREADPGGLSYWSDVLVGQGFEPFIVSFLANSYDEIIAKKSGTQPVVGLTISDVMTTIIAKLSKP